MGAVDKTRKRCFKCQGIGHFASEFPNQRLLTMDEYEKLDLPFEKDTETASENLDEEEDDTDDEVEFDRENYMLTRVLHVESQEEDQREKLFH